jgi:anaerobic selenocysteine-containing dehydrogenase
VGHGPETLRFSKLIILWGSNTLTSNHHLWRSITMARQAGAHLVVIDPIQTRTAKVADTHLAPIPGTDAALALGLLNVVLAEGAEDRDFIERHTLGWEAFRQRILEYPPERVAGICGLPVGAIMELGSRLAHTRPTGIRVTMGLQRHGGGRDGGPDDHLHPGRHGGLAPSGRRRRVRHPRILRVNWAGLYRDDLRPAPRAR